MGIKQGRCTQQNTYIYMQELDLLLMLCYMLASNKRMLRKKQIKSKVIDSIGNLNNINKKNTTTINKLVTKNNNEKKGKRNLAQPKYLKTQC